MQQRAAKALAPATGPATSTITGTLRSHAGKPIAGASGDAFGQSGAISFKTQADGHYSVKVPAGRYTVSFTVHGVSQLVPQTDNEVDANVYSVAADHTITVDETMRPMGAISGTITKADGKPMAGAELAAFDPDTHTMTMGATTNRAGKYTMYGLPGTYGVFVSPREDGIGQFLHQQRVVGKAARVQVTEDSSATMNEKLFPVGSVSGRLLDVHGKPLAKADVMVETFGLGDNWSQQAITATADKAGRFRFAAVPAGRYRITYQPANRLHFQHSKPFTVGVGKNSVVNGTLAAGGDLAISPVDRVTGKPVKDFCVSPTTPFYTDRVCTTGATLTLKDLAPEKAHLSLDVNGYRLVRGTDLSPTVRVGKVTKVAAKLYQCALLDVTVLDRATRKPVSDVTLQAERVSSADSMINVDKDATDDEGRVRVTLDTGVYRLFARPKTDNPYGRQWVGTAGGTGQRDQAALITVTNGKITKAPVVLLDHAGRITGKVTNPDGSPAAHVSLRERMSSYNEWDFTGTDSHTDMDGRYELAGFGPYQWSLVATPNGARARQWAGGVIDATKADQTTVEPGATATLNLALRPGITMRGALVGAPKSFTRGYVVATNATTGDEVGTTELTPGASTYRFTILGSQPVKLSYVFLIDGSARDRTGWYGGKDFTSATVVSAPATGEQVADITVK